MLERMKRDIKVIFERDPAARSPIEVLLNYPGLHAIWVHRLTHRLYLNGFKSTARLLSQIARFFTQVEIHPGAQIGEGLFIDHGCGIVIGETTIIGRDVTLYQGVTLGGTGKETGKRHPTLGDRVIVSSGAKVLGNITIGDGTKIGAGSVVLDDVPPCSTVVGIPGKVVRRCNMRLEEWATPEGRAKAISICPECAEYAIDLDHNHLPDPVEDELKDIRSELALLRKRLEQLEAKK